MTEWSVFVLAFLALLLVGLAIAQATIWRTPRVRPALGTRFRVDKEMLLILIVAGGALLATSLYVQQSGVLAELGVLPADEQRLARSSVSGTGAATSIVASIPPTITASLPLTGATTSEPQASATARPAPTSTATTGPTASPTESATPTETAVPTATETPLPSATATRLPPSPTASATPTSVPTEPPPSPTHVPSATATLQPAPTRVRTATIPPPTATNAPAPAATPLPATVEPTAVPASSVPPVPVLLQPLDGELVSGSLNFTWSADLPAGGRYELQLWPYDGTPGSTAQTIEPRWSGTVPPAPGIYNWRVLVLDADGRVLAVSEAFTFAWDG